MKKTDLLSDITSRAAGALPISPAAQFHIADSGVQEQFSRTTRALRDTYPFLWFDRAELSEDELAQYDGMFVWLAHVLKTYAEPQSPLLQHLLALTSLMNCDGRLWHKLCQAVGNPPLSLIEDLRGIVRTNRVDGQRFLARTQAGADQIPILLAYAASRNWTWLQWSVKREAHEFQSPLKQQAYAALDQLHPASLQAFFEEEHDFFEVNTYVLQAPPTESLRLAVASSNWTLKFWTVFHSAQWAAEGGSSFPAEWSALLAEAAQVPDEWIRWMAVFNQYPGRYPQLQDSLGDILSSVSEHAIDTYVALLGDYEGNRLHVATTLKFFSTKAPLQKRKRLWSAAYGRWLHWDFGRTEHSSFVSGVKHSAFDFPLVGYIVECLDDAARATWYQELCQRAAAIERDWHADLAVPVSERFKLISTYQLLTHAEHVIAGAKSWLPGLPLHCPDWEDRTFYRSLKYDQAFGTSTFYKPAVQE